MIDFSLIIESLPVLFQGILITLQIAFFAGLLGCLGGFVLGLILSGNNNLLKPFISAYVTLIRGTPMLIQIIIIYYLLPEININIPPIWAATFAIGLNSCAYVSQIIRSGIASISAGQIEAAKVLGLTPIQTALSITLPQAIRNVLPALSNEITTLIKDSSLASIIGVMELSKQASIIRSRTYDAFSVLFIVAILYLCITSLATFLLRMIEKKSRLYAQN